MQDSVVKGMLRYLFSNESITEMLWQIVLCTLHDTLYTARLRHRQLQLADL